MKTGYWVAIGVAVALFIGGTWLYSSINTTRNEGIQQEQSLTATYSDNQNYLSAYVSTIYEQLGIANRKSAVLDTILRHAVEGRYGENGFSANGAFFAAVQESYPDLTQNLNLFDRILDQVSAGREQFRSRQSLLLDKVRGYNTWRQSGIVRSQIVRMIGFPSSELKAQVGGQVVASGADALTRMSQVIVTGSTVQAYQTGQMEPLQIR